MDFGISMLWFWSAYMLVTLVGIGHTCFNWFVLKMDEDTKPPIKSMYDIKSYAATVKYHPLYNIILWPVFSYLYLIMTQPNDPWFEALILGLSWSAITIVFDVVAWVLIKHPWSMRWKEMYVDYQPWISLIYLSIFISPFIGALFI
ncbi:MAG TPA: hypothetical protein VHR47_03025 [Bacillota bacterium]|nr:hypothetical protein [Bacillota bacterium]